jgi:hypothetical protein
MGKQHTLKRIEAGEDTTGFRYAGGVPALFEDHYKLSIRSMTPEAAAHTAYTAVQNHLASLEDTEAGDRMA